MSESAPVRPPASFDARFYPPLLITVILLSAHITVGILESPWQTVLAITTSIVTEVVLGYATLGRMPHLASAYITGISVGVLVRTPLYWPFAYCAVISIMTKYVIRMGGRHLWNPSNFGVSFALFFYPQYVTHLSIQWGNASWSVAFVWSLGLIVVTRLRRVHICLTYVTAFLVLSYLRQFITGHPFLAEVAPITGPMYQLFILYMITDPGTTVKSKRGQMFVVTMVALMEFIFRCLPTYFPNSSLVAGAAIHAPFYALFLVGPTFLIAEILQRERISPPVAANCPATGPVPGP
jgi:Na+-translocating ferredoxin:NAD+ oxidoreductase RnfD subunit